MFPDPPRERFRVFDPPEADPVSYCWSHYRAWQREHRDTDAWVIDMEDTGEAPCAVCQRIRDEHPSA